MYLLDLDFFFLRRDFFYDFFTLGEGSLYSLYYEWEHKRKKREKKKRKKKEKKGHADTAKVGDTWYLVGSFLVHIHL